MSKRNFTLLIIILALITIAVFGFLYFRSETSTPKGEETIGTNFFSQFNPFGIKSSPTTTPSVNTSEYAPPEKEMPEVKLTKISSMPIAGFTVFSKERLKEIPIVVPTTTPNVPYKFGSTTLRNGTTGEGVMEIQRFLNDTLNLKLELDGILDEEVVNMIKQWQSNNGLVVDGIAGPKTKAMMYSSVNQKTEATKPTPPPTEFVSALRYVDKATGNIYQTFVDKIEERKFSGTIIPKIYEAYFGNRGESVVMRYLKENGKTIETFVGTLPKEVLGGDTTGTNEIKGAFLPDNIKDISISPDGSKMFYLWNNGDNAIGTTLSFLNSKKTQIFDSSFTEWLSFWPTNNTITLSTKPSYDVLGYMYTIDTTGKNLRKTLGDINGLTTLGSPNGKLILYGGNNLSNNLLFGIYHTDTRGFDILGVKTLPEKCVWGSGSDSIYCAVPKFIASGEYPDIWYQGEASFSDQFWKIDAKTGNGMMILDPTTISEGEEIDGIKLALDEGENNLFFVNKKDNFLWKLDLK